METQILGWLTHYGYGAAFPAVVSDPSGVPWAWVFLMLLAQQAGKNILLMLILGFASLWVCDLSLYFIGSIWGTRLLAWTQTRRPDWKDTIENACSHMQKRGALAAVIGRYMPLVGRWVGLGAGMARVPLVPFALYSALGAAISAFGFGIPAHLLGRKIVDNPFLLQGAMTLCIIGMSGGILACLWTAWRSKTRKVAL